MNQEDRNRMTEAIATLTEMSAKYDTPITLNINFHNIDYGLMEINMLGESYENQWFPQFKDRLSHIMRAANLLCWLNYKLEKTNEV